MYPRIEDHGIIGDMRTAAMVALDGTIDWLCLPRFDSPSVFASILDHDKGGRFALHPEDAGALDYRQFYWPGTNVLVSRFLSERGVGEVQDFMPVSAVSGGRHVTRLVRRVRVTRGKLRFRLRCEPAFDYARAGHRAHLCDSGAVLESDGLRLGLSSPVKLERTERGVGAAFTLDEGQGATFVLSPRDPGDGDPPACPGDDESRALFEQTVSYWRAWLSRCRYTGRWREMVHRSALTLKLLTYEPTGAIVAAPTTSLPNRVGGGRNWDFRFTWIRDASFILYALMRLGFSAEAEGFMGWLDERFSEAGEAAGSGDAGPGPLRALYGIDGRQDLTETQLDHLAGYRGSRPVRVGNHAHRTLQLDIYGELLDAVYLYNKHGSNIGYSTWRQVQRLVDWLGENWDRPDEGIWEIRDDPRHFVYSKVMCWVAMDRAVRLARKRSFPADLQRWRRTRDAIYNQIMDKGWDADRGAMVQSYGGDCLDGALLIMPLVFFMSPTDPRMTGTLDAVMKTPRQGGLTSGGLVHRFDTRPGCDDGVAGREGTFNMCTFWLVEALTRAGKTRPRRLEEARLLFEQALGYANHLGLYAEQTGDRGEALGNFPQGFTHLALISAAFNLDRTLGEGV